MSISYVVYRKKMDTCKTKQLESLQATSLCSFLFFVAFFFFFGWLFPFLLAELELRAIEY